MLITDGSTYRGPTKELESYELKLCDDFGVMATLPDVEAITIIKKFVGVVTAAAEQNKALLEQHGCRYVFAEWEIIVNHYNAVAGDGPFARVIFHLETSRVHEAMAAAQAFTSREWGRYLARPEHDFLCRPPQASL